MRIMFISRAGPPTYSGAGRGVFDYARHLKVLGHEVIYLSARFSPDMPRRETIDGVPFVRFTTRSTSRLGLFLFHLQCAWWLVCHCVSIDVVHFSNMPKLGFPVLIVAKALRKKIYVTMTLYGSDDFPSILRRRFGRLQLWFYHQCDAVFSISSKMIETSEPYKTIHQPLIHLPYIIDFRRFFPCENDVIRHELRECYGVPDDCPVAVFSGAVIPRKGVDLLVQAWGVVAQALPSAHLYIVGPRQFKNDFSQSNKAFADQLDARVHDLGLENSIFFTGDCANEVPEYLRLADCFVFPSRQEGLGLALIEALATGLPAIVCAQPWLPKDLVRHNETGLVCQPTPDALAEVLLAVLNDSDLRKRLGTQARSEAEQVYHPDRIIAKLLAVYSDSLKPKSE